jgi:hypothetical protein
MEGLGKRVLVLGSAFLMLGVLFHAKAPTLIQHDGKVPDEKWLEGISPKEVPGYQMAVLKDGPEITYRMTQETYETLVPYGIVARVFGNGYENYDTVVIMSAKKDSFHDPRVCFTSQGWNLDQQEVIQVDSKAYGKVPITLATMIRGSEKSFAAFFYKGPNGFVAKNTELKWQMFMHQLTKFEDTEGVFYRFIPLHPGSTKQQLEKFIDTFLTESQKSSKGLL